MDQVTSKDGTPDRVRSARQRTRRHPGQRRVGRPHGRTPGWRSTWRPTSRSSTTTDAVAGPAATRSPYAIDREVEDIDAVDRCGRRIRVPVRGSSSGAALAPRSPRPSDCPADHEARAVGAAVHPRRTCPRPPGRSGRAVRAVAGGGSARRRGRSTSWRRSWGCRRSSSPMRGASPGGPARGACPHAAVRRDDHGRLLAPY